ncbi:MAG: NAD(P)/FAD-dependent oxidoreductase [Acidimicrobiales bacterium]|nr:NAD(P)/FAD-dependent oxidoreductase [Acidimicrobiales bacterium]
MSDTATRDDARTDVTAEHLDVVIVGAGISGIGSAYHLTTQRPGTSFVVLDALESFGGTWLTHTYPGIRSDSDLYTFGYRFKPWTGPPIATAEQILTYMGEVIDDNDLARHIRYQHRIDTASWSSETATWTLDGVRTDTGEAVRFVTPFLWMCQGYYRHSEGYTPQWPGMEEFRGRIVHPQTWPDDLDLTDREVIVIGSGATAATLVPAIAGDCRHVTLLQRSPTFFVTGRNENDTAEMLRSLEIPEEWIHEIVRRKILHDQAEVVRLAAEQPDMVKDLLLAEVRARLGDDYDVETHFSPRYRPWQQRIAFIPDGDLFEGIRTRQASVVTDQIDTFTEAGIRLASGDELTADVIITATGFDLCVMGDIAFSVDGEPVEWPDTVTYHGMMFTGVPNLVWIMGYFRASWTLRADLIGDFVCRVLTHLDELGARQVTPVLLAEERDLERLPWMDPDNFNPGYLMRSMHLLPKRLDRPEWQHTQDYWVEKETLPAIDLDDGRLEYR